MGRTRTTTPTVLNQDQINAIKWAINDVQKRREKATRYRDYYQGEQDLMIALNRVQTIFANRFKDFRFNLCSVVVDALADRLQVSGFSSPDVKEKQKQLQRQAKTAQLQAQVSRQEAQRQQMLEQSQAAALTPEQQANPATQVRANQGASLPPQNPNGGQSQNGNSQNGQPQGLPDILPSVVEPKEVEDSLGKEADEIWKKNAMDVRAGYIHQEAISSGDSFIIVWKNPDGEVTLYDQKAHEMAVEYDPDRPGQLKRAAKVWRADSVEIRGVKKKGVRVTLYYPDRIEKYGAHATSGWPQPRRFVPIQDEGDPPGGIMNPWEVVPVFHFANKGGVSSYGRSELVDAIPIQNFTNKEIFDLLVASEYVGFPQRYVIGVEAPVDNQGREINPFRAGVENLWAFSAPPSGEDERYPTPTLGQFPMADLTQIATIVGLGARMMAQATATPTQYFEVTDSQSGGGPSTPVSGESQKTSDQKLTNKVRDRTIAFGQRWEEVMQLAIRMNRGESTAADGINLEVEWDDTRPRAEAEVITNALNKQKLGVSDRQALKEVGYTDEQIDGFEADKALKFYAQQQAGPPVQTLGNVLDSVVGG